jgi:hypothetical protein
MRVSMHYGIADMQVTRQCIEEQCNFTGDYCPSEEVCAKAIDISETSKHFQFDHCFIENVKGKYICPSH